MSFRISCLVRTQSLQTPLHIVAGHKTHSEHVKFLMKEWSADICATDHVRRTPIQCCYSTIQLLALLLQLGNTPIHVACNRRGLTNLKILLSAIAKNNRMKAVNTRNEVSFPEASFVQCATHYTSLGQKGDTPLHLVMTDTFPTFIETLMDGGANPNMKNKVRSL